MAGKSKIGISVQLLLLIICILSTCYLFFYSCKKEYTSSACPDADTQPYLWTQIEKMGNGSFQEAWRHGTFPLGIEPVLDSRNHLWMTGQKASWESLDGMNWEKHEKADWGERISHVQTQFQDTLWMLGGMMYGEREFKNDIWFSPDGLQWTKNETDAEWSPRKGQAIVTFKNRLWLFGGSNAVDGDLLPTSFLNDAWSSGDGKHWILEKDFAAWPPREYPKILVYRDTLFLLGGQGFADVWKSANGRDWTQLLTEASWKRRFDHGAKVFDNKIWIFGGRDEISTNAHNDVWYSEDGFAWKNQTPCAPWTKRSAAISILFENKLWIFSGKHTGAADNWGGDIWTME